jgi:hypothetical protein
MASGRGAPPLDDLDLGTWHDHFDAQRDGRGTIGPPAPALPPRGISQRPGGLARARPGHPGGGGVAFVDAIPATRVAGRPSQPM